MKLRDRERKHKERFGSFLGHIDTTWLDDGRFMKVISHASYIDPKGNAWNVRPGDVVNGASIPRFLWRIVGSPFTGLYRKPSVFHDRYCTPPFERDSPQVHQMFYYACRAAGCGIIMAFVLWAAVRTFGPRFRKS